MQEYISLNPGSVNTSDALWSIYLSLTANSQHVDGSLVQLDENTVVDLSKTEELQNFFDLGSDLVDTTDTHDKGQFWLRGHMVVSRFPGLAFEPKVITLLITVFFDVLLSTFEDVNTLCSPGQTVLGQLRGAGSPVF
jgi:hypothetical protein